MLSFDHLADRYLAEHAYRFKKSADEDERSLRLHLRPTLGQRRYAEIRRRDVVQLIETIYASGRQALAVRLKATISKIFAFAIWKDLMDVNPAAGIGRIADLAPRERVLSDDEIRFAWQAFMMPPVSARVGLALRLVLAIGQRPGEVAGLRWNEVSNLADPQNALWTIPGARVKNGREHTVPLSPLAVALLSEAKAPLHDLASGQEHAFKSPHGKKAISAHALAVAMARIAGRVGGRASVPHTLANMPGAQTWLIDPPTPHDLRRTAATRMRALGMSSEDVKHVLNHAQTSVLSRHYDRYDPLLEKRRALDRWASELERIVAQQLA
jgi:integrase